jgi:hypothetical protein
MRGPGYAIRVFADMPEAAIGCRIRARSTGWRKVDTMNNTTSILNDLIETLKDAQEGFRSASENAAFVGIEDRH